MIGNLLKQITTTFLITCLIIWGISGDQVALAQTSPNLLVSAASSLQQALQTLTAKYSVKTSYNFGGSGSLQQQIEQGAPVDIFISAAVKQMDILEAKELLTFRTNLLTNQLALITPKSSTVKLTDFRELLNPNIKRIAIAEPRSVPVGQYATEVLQRIGILEQVKPKLIFGNNVRFVLTAVETGEVEAGIVYITDAKSSSKVTIAAIAEPKYHSPIIYPIGIIKSSKNLTAAKAYIQFLRSPKAQSIFQKYGFGVVSSKLSNKLSEKLIEKS